MHCGIWDSSLWDLCNRFPYQVHMHCFWQNILFAIGGANPSHRPDAKLMRAAFSISEDDVVLTNIDEMRTAGAKLPPLQATQLLGTKPGEFVLYGGMRLDNMSAASDLWQLQLKGGRRSYMDITVLEQHGDVPSARFGHTLTKIDNQSVLMHGGLSLDLRWSDHFVQDRFRQVLSDQHFYILDVPSKTWTKLGVEAHCARAFHSAVLYKDSVFYVGGLRSRGSLGPKERIHLGEIMEVNLMTKSVCLRHVAGWPEVYISGHASVVIDNKLYVYGGVTQHSTAEIKKVDKNGSNQMYIMSLDELSGSMETAYYDQGDYRATGHSMAVLDRDCIMVIGGSMRGILMYTNKTMCPSPCDLDNCIISQSDIVSPIAWIKCEGSCKKWLHWFCVGITREPRKFVCVNCRPKK